MDKYFILFFYNNNSKSHHLKILTYLKCSSFVPNPILVPSNLVKACWHDIEVEMWRPLAVGFKYKLVPEKSNANLNRAV